MISKQHKCMFLDAEKQDFKKNTVFHFELDYLPKSENLDQR